MDQQTKSERSIRPRRWFLGSLLTVAVGAVAALAVTQAARAEEGPESYKGKPAPNIALTTLAGDKVSLADLKGKVVLIDFWATWCGPCVASLPHINEIAGKKEWQEKGLTVWAVNLREQPAKVKKFLEDKKLTLTVPLDTTGKAAASYDVQGIPTTLVIGRDGKVAEAFVGAGPDTPKQLDAAIEKALKQK